MSEPRPPHHIERINGKAARWDHGCPAECDHEQTARFNPSPAISCQSVRHLTECEPRRRSSACSFPSRPAWLPVTHAPVRSCKDHGTFARDPANAGIRTQARILKSCETIGLLALNMLGHDDPEHRQLRALVDQAFQRRTRRGDEPENNRRRRSPSRQTGGTRTCRTHGQVLPELRWRHCEMLGLPAQDHPVQVLARRLEDPANIGAVIRVLPGVT